MIHTHTHTHTHVWSLRSIMMAMTSDGRKALHTAFCKDTYKDTYQDTYKDTYKDLYVPAWP